MKSKNPKIQTRICSESFYSKRPMRNNAWKFKEQKIKHIYTHLI